MLKHCFVFHSKPCAEKSQGIDKDNGKRLFAAKTRRVWNIESLIETLLPRSAIYWGYISHSRLSYFTPPVKIFNAKFALRKKKIQISLQEVSMKAVYVPFPVPQKDEPWQNDITFKEGLFHGEKRMQLQVQSKIGFGKTRAAFEVLYILRCFGFR